MEKKNEKQEIEVVKKAEVAVSPQETIALAISKGSNLEQIEKLMLLQERFEATQAKKSYVRAMSDFKANAPLVDKDKLNNQYKSKYTSLGNLINTVSPVLSKYGLSASWDIKQNGIIEVTCKMTHCDGHSETATMQAPADGSGSKNPIQQIKSTITYLKAVTFESICGLASTDANLDDDGNVSGATFITDAQRSELFDIGTALKVDWKLFLEHFNIESLEKLPLTDLPRAKILMETKRNQQKAKVAK